MLSVGSICKGAGLFKRGYGYTKKGLFEQNWRVYLRTFTRLGIRKKSHLAKNSTTESTFRLARWAMKLLERFMDCTPCSQTLNSLFRLFLLSELFLWVYVGWLAEEKSCGVLTRRRQLYSWPAEACGWAHMLGVWWREQGDKRTSGWVFMRLKPIFA